MDDLSMDDSKRPKIRSYWMTSDFVSPGIGIPSTFWYAAETTLFESWRVGDDFFWKLTATGSLWSCLSSTLHDQLWTHAIETFKIIYFDPSPSLSQTGLSKLLWTVTVKQGKIMRYAPLTCPRADEMTIKHCQHTNNRFANWNKHPCFDVPTLKSSMLGSTEAGDLFVAKVMPRVAPNLLS